MQIFLILPKNDCKNKTDEFADWCEWILTIYKYGKSSPISSIEETKQFDWLNLLFKSQIKDFKNIEWKVDSSISEISTQNSSITNNELEKSIVPSSNVIFSQKSLANQVGYKWGKSAFGSKTIEGYARASALRLKDIENS